MSDAPKRTYNRRSTAQKIEDMKADLAKLERKSRLETMDAHPFVNTLSAVIDKLTARVSTAKGTVNGRGRGNGAASRIRVLQAEIADLVERIDRDEVVLAEGEDLLESLASFRDQILDGEIEAEQATMPELPSWYLEYSETERERNLRFEAEARAEQRGKSVAQIEEESAEESPVEQTA
jgi:hypothetical protein